MSFTLNQCRHLWIEYKTHPHRDNFENTKKMLFVHYRILWNLWFVELSLEMGNFQVHLSWRWQQGVVRHLPQVNFSKRLFDWEIDTIDSFRKMHFKIWVSSFSRIVSIDSSNFEMISYMDEREKRKFLQYSHQKCLLTFVHRHFILRQMILGIYK